jgi:membrane protein
VVSPKQLLRLMVEAAKNWSADYAPSMGAAIAYYTVFSLAPLLVIVIAVAGAAFGREAVQGLVSDQLTGLVGPQAAEMVEGLVAASSDTDRGLVAGLISVGVLLVGATTVFAELQSALDRIWKVPERARPSGLWGLLRARLLSFGLILGLAFLLMVSLVASAALAAIGSWFGGLLPGWEVLLQVANTVLSLAVLSLLFGAIYKFMPSTPIAWRDVAVGAVATALLFEVGKLAIGLYIGKSGMDETFQAAGAIVLLLAWVYYAAQIFLLGAEFTRAWAAAHGSRRPGAAAAPTPTPRPAAPAAAPGAREPPRSPARP